MSDQIEQNTASSELADEIIRQQEFGLQLKAAREQAGLTIVDVAEALKLKEDIIRALEQSQVDKLPVSAFTQGYIRSYCRLLKLPAEELIEIYNNMLPDKEASLSPTSDVSIQRTSNDGSMRMATIAIMIIGVVLLVFWWLQDNGETALPQQTRVIEQPQSDNNTLTAEAEVDTQVQTAETASESDSPSAAMDNITSPESSQVVDAVEPEKPSVSNERKIIAGEDLLVIRSSGESWTEIEDANGQRLLFQLMKSGDDHQLQGRAPFRIFLGNAPSVEIMVNNQAINLSSYIRQNNIAHITVRANAAVQTVRNLPRLKPATDVQIDEQQDEESLVE